MKILQINCVYGSGSTGKITRDIHTTLLSNGIESFVCYGRGKDTEDKNVVKTASDMMSRIRRIESMFDGMPYRFTRWTNNRIENEIKAISPDIVHLQCINGYFVDIYRLLEFLKKKKTPTIITLHAEFMYTGGCVYALKCKQWEKGCIKCDRLKYGLGVIGLDRVKKNYELMFNAIQGFDNLKIVGVSDWISSRAKRSKIMRDCDVITIHNGIETQTVFHPRETKKIKEKYNLASDRFVVLSVVPNLESDLKGGKLMMELSQKMDAKKYQFVVVGAKGEVNNKPDNMIVIPYTDSQDELAELYSAADVFVLASKMDNYPTVCIEANSCGTPVIGFDVGGVSETIYNGMGEVVPYGDIVELERSISKWSKKKPDITDKVIEEVMNINSKERMVCDYINLYRGMLEDNR